jgi:hypothetical protein
MADRRLRETEAVSRRGEASQVPDREKDPQKIEVHRDIIFIHVVNYNYEFDLVQCAAEIRSVRAARDRPTEAGDETDGERKTFDRRKADHCRIASHFRNPDCSAPAKRADLREAIIGWRGRGA